MLFFRIEKEIVPNFDEIISKTYYGCSECPMTSINFKIFQNHIKAAHPTLEEKHICKICGQPFQTPNLLNHHKSQEHKSTCNTTKNSAHFNSLKLLSQRLTDRSLKTEISDPNELSFLNHTIEKSKYENRIILEHLALVHSENNGNTGHKDSTSADHVLIDNLEFSNSFECDICQRKFKKKVLLKNHVKTHKVTKGHICNINHKNFEQKNYLSKHLQTTYSKKFNCHVCSKVFSVKNSLKMHLKVAHQGEMHFTCQKCGKILWDSISLKENKKIIPDKMKHIACDSCDKVLSTKKDSTCDACGKVFAEKGYLSMHIKCVHMKIKKFCCAVCGKKFGQKHSLNTHIKGVHEKIKDHPCKICQKRLSSNQMLRSHIDVIHYGIKSFTCVTCGKQFSHKGNLNAHTKSVHKK